VRGFRKQPLFKVLIDPRLGDNAGPIVRADFFLVGLNQEIECSRLDIALLGENALKRAYTQLHFRQVRPWVIVRKLGRRLWLMIGHEKSYPSAILSAKTLPALVSSMLSYCFTCAHTR
jgi:hypothetical protein